MAELIHALGINWKLLIAQIVNFAILAFVLQRFVYAPIVKLLAERKKRIEDAEKNVIEIQKKLEGIKLLEEKTLSEARSRSGIMLKEAEKTALKLRGELVENAQREALKIIADGKKKLAEEEKSAALSLKRELGSLISLSIEKTVGDVLTKEAQKDLEEAAFKKALSFEGSHK